MGKPTSGRTRAARGGSRRVLGDDAPAFTLLETLIVVAITALLLALLMPALRLTRARAQALNCASNLRSVGMQFQFFADNTAAEGRGDSEALGANRFRVNDFLDSLYHIDEFWDIDSADEGALEVGNEPGMCPSGGPRLVKRAGYPCGSEAIQPIRNVSFAMNMRLYRGRVIVGGQSLLAPVNLTYVGSDILNHPYVPVMMDVDGEQAARRGVSPFYTAPPIAGENDPYSDGRYWMPSRRHPGGVNVALMGGQVIRSTTPEREAWNWSYRANVGH